MHKRFFGATRPIVLPEVIRIPEDRDEERLPRFFSSGETSFIQSDDWELLRSALAMTRDYPYGQIGGQSLQICSFENAWYPMVVRGRVNDATLELFLGSGIEAQIASAWQRELRSAINAHAKDKRVF